MPHTYTVTQHWSSGTRIVAEGVRSMAEAKRLAREAWNRASRSVSIEDEQGHTIVATQAVGRGLLWA